jgi:SnoaL-like polyketide cyclase
MSNHPLVVDFYRRIWNSGEASAVSELLCAEFLFRGSLGAELRGLAAFWDYVSGVRAALADYRCDIETCVTELWVLGDLVGLDAVLNATQKVMT